MGPSDVRRWKNDPPATGNTSKQDTSPFRLHCFNSEKKKMRDRDVLFKWNMEQSIFSLPEPQREKKGDCGHASYQYFHAT